MQVGFECGRQGFTREAPRVRPRIERVDSQVALARREGALVFVRHTRAVQQHQRGGRGGVSLVVVALAAHALLDQLHPTVEVGLGCGSQREGEVDDLGWVVRVVLEGGVEVPVGAAIERGRAAIGKGDREVG